MADFELLEIEETVDGRVWAFWRTTADDGNPLEEGDFFVPEGDDLEKEVKSWLKSKQAERDQINQRPKKREPKVRFKRKTAKLSKAQKESLKDSLFKPS